MIALGDALAVALLDRMGLTAEQYKVFHPGGKLGQRLLLVKELMVKTEDLPIVSTNAKMDEALIALTEKNLGAVIISDDKKTLKGIITDGDLKRHMGHDLLERSVTEIMTPTPKTISGQALAVEAMKLMTNKSGNYLSSLIVTQDDQFIGMIRLQDCLQAGLA